MKLARHVMPGNAASRNPSRRARCDRVAKGVRLSCAISKAKRHESYRSLRDGSCLAYSQAFHAWLPSFHPYGIIRQRPNRRPPNKEQKSE